ncbi:hypothetical protein TKK_0013852 [Trichogramma kaykai]
MHSFFMTNQNKSFPNSSDVIAKSNNKENDASFAKQITENVSDESSKSDDDEESESYSEKSSEFSEDNRSQSSGTNGNNHSRWNSIRDEIVLQIKKSEAKILEKIDEIEKTAGNNSNSFLKQLSFIRPEGFPMQSMEEFDELKNNAEKCKSLIDYLKLYGGENLETAAKNYIKESMTDELSSKFIWCKKRESDKNAITLWNTHWATLIWGILNNTFGCTIEQFSQAMQYGLRLAKQPYRDHNARDSKRNEVDSEKGRGAKKTLLQEMADLYNNAEEASNVSDDDMDSTKK